MRGHVATVETRVAARRDDVWRVLTAPGSRPEIMFGAETVTDWQVGSPVVWRGEWDGKAFEDKGQVLEVDAGRRLVVTHWSPLSGAPDVPESYHTLTWTLEDDGAGTVVRLEQDNNASPEEAEHSAANWRTMVDGLRTVAEGEHGARR
ncbi:SRPBCC domain-containing protein [Actinotalea ferrariae]|uniref:SRPBCC domain-containing protein n=1 Tax=Actinotalea ferrariae TaxID=1386098 RepID=UPI0027E09D34|nr:SRPBCC domain-containing protein [Actinotalea ferrariae]